MRNRLMSLHDNAPADIFDTFQSLKKRDKKAINKFLSPSEKLALKKYLNTDISKKLKPTDIGLSEFTPWLSKCLAGILDQKSTVNQTVTPTVKSVIPDVLAGLKNEDRDTRSTLSFWPDNSNHDFITRLLKSKSAAQ